MKSLSKISPEKKLKESWGLIRLELIFSEPVGRRKNALTLLGIVIFLWAWKKMSFSLRTSSPKGFDHYRIETGGTGDSYFIEPEFKFPDLKSLIHRYQEEKQPVLAAEILYPLLTPKNFQRQFSSTLFSDDDFTLSGNALSRPQANTFLTFRGFSFS